RALVRGLAADPKDRWPSLDALIDELERATRVRRTGVALGVVAMATAALIAVFALGRSSGTPVATCDAAGAPADSVWTPQQKATVANAFQATGAKFAADSLAALDARLVAWRSRWRASAIASCQATRSGAQSPAMLDLRGACLQRERTEL